MSWSHFIRCYNFYAIDVAAAEYHSDEASFNLMLAMEISVSSGII